MNIGEKIKDLRLYNALTQYELSKKADISRSVLSAYENNIAIPTATAIAKIAVALNVSADYLLGLENDYGAKTAAPMGDAYTTEERNFIKDFRKLPKGMREILRTTLTAMLNDASEEKI